MAFKAILKVEGEERTLLTYHNYLFDMWGVDFSKVTKTYPTLYDYMAVAKASPYAFRRYGEPLGGLFDFTMESTDDDDFFYHWFKSNLKEGRTYLNHGVIELYDHKDEYMPMRRIEFWDAWITEISEHHSAYSNIPMILAFTISPATIRVNKQLVFQKNWKQTDINQQGGQPQEKAEPAIKRIYWKGRERGIERKDIMLNHSTDLEIEFSKFTEGDNVEFTVKQNKGRRIKGQAKEFTINGTIEENGTMTIPYFKVECDFKADNQNFGNIEFYYNDNKVGELKENFGWTWIKDGGLLKIFANIESKVNYLAMGCTEGDYKEAVNNQFKRTLELSSDGLVTGKLFFDGTYTKEPPQVVPKLDIIEEAKKVEGFFTLGTQTTDVHAKVESMPIDDSFLTTDLGESGVHELLHTLRLHHPFALTQAEDTKLINIGWERLITVQGTDPNIAYNIMNYDVKIIDGKKLSDLWKLKRPEYITKGQLQFIFNEIDRQQKGKGTVQDVAEASHIRSEWDTYWDEANFPGKELEEQIRPK